MAPIKTASIFLSFLFFFFFLNDKGLLDDPFEKIDSDRLLVVPGEDAFAEALDHAGLADGAVAYNHHLLHGSECQGQKRKGPRRELEWKEVSWHLAERNMFIYTLGHPLSSLGRTKKDNKGLNHSLNSAISHMVLCLCLHLLLSFLQLYNSLPQFGAGWRSPTPPAYSGV